jgi:hypothetical protein
MEVTDQQIKNWRAYEAVRRSGKINMWDATRGAKLAGLTREDYMDALSNYNKYKAAALEQEEVHGNA